MSRSLETTQPKVTDVIGSSRQSPIPGAVTSKINQPLQTPPTQSRLAVVSTAQPSASVHLNKEAQSVSAIESSPIKGFNTSASAKKDVQPASPIKSASAKASSGPVLANRELQSDPTIETASIKGPTTRVPVKEKVQPVSTVAAASTKAPSTPAPVKKEIKPVSTVATASTTSQHTSTLKKPDFGKYATATSQTASKQKVPDSTLTKEGATDTGNVASASSNLGGIAENLNQRQEEWAMNVLVGLPPIEGSLEKSIHSRGEYVAPKETDVYAQGPAKKAHLLGEHLRPVGRFKTKEPSLVVSLSTLQNTLKSPGFQASQEANIDAISRHFNQLRLSKSEKAPQNPLTKPGSKVDVALPPSHPSRIATEGTDTRHREAKETDAINSSKQPEVRVQPETSLVLASRTSSPETVDLGFRAERFTSEGAPEIISHTDLGHSYRLVMHDGGYTVKLVHLKRSAASAGDNVRAIASTSQIEQSTTQAESDADRKKGLFGKYHRPVPGSYTLPEWLDVKKLPPPGDVGGAMRSQLEASGVKIPANAPIKMKESHEKGEETLEARGASKSQDVKTTAATSMAPSKSTTPSTSRGEPKPLESIWARPATASSPTPSVAGSTKSSVAAKPRPGPSADPGAAARAQYLRSGTLFTPRLPLADRITRRAAQDDEAGTKRDTPDFW